MTSPSAISSSQATKAASTATPKGHRAGLRGEVWALTESAQQHGRQVAEVRRLLQADADASAQLRTDMEALRRGWDEVDARLRVLEDERAVALARDASSEGEKGRSEGEKGRSEGEKGRERQTTFLPGA